MIARLIALAALAFPLAALSQTTDPACKQEPGSRFFWIERAFCDMPMGGPEKAHGVIIWNHGISGTLPSWRAPAPPVLRLAQARGWDVIMLKRHNLAETGVGSVLDRTVKRTLDEVAAQKKAGYRKVALAGQSFGGYVTLETIDTSPDIDAAIAFAPGVKFGGGTGNLDPTIIERILRRANVGRLAVVFPKNDSLFGNIARGERAQPILSKRDFPWLMIDESNAPDVVEHGGGVSGRFALRYGPCLVEFLAAATLPPGRVTCTAGGDDWRVVRVLFPADPGRTKFMVDPDGVPPEIRSLLGPRWAILGDAIVVVAPVMEGNTLRLMYRSTTSAGVYDATLADGALRATLANRSTVQISTRADATITWTASDGSRTLTAPLRRTEGN